MSGPSRHRRHLVASTGWLAGRGLHSGCPVRLRIIPGSEGTGIIFRRLDRDGRELRAGLAAARPVPRRLLLEEDGLRVSTAEHLLAALYGLDIEDACVELDGGDELPALDGSAAPFVRALWPIAEEIPGCPEGAPCWGVVSAFVKCAGDASCRMVPDDALVLLGRIHFTRTGSRPARPRGVTLLQELRWRQDDPQSFRLRLAPARSFGFVDEAALLRARGLARGAGLRSVLVYGPLGPLNPEGTRFADEAVRHNLLDALGALALLGGPLRGRLILDRCGHSLLVGTLRAALAAGALRRV